jgi:hypothetical protein
MIVIAFFEEDSSFWADSEVSMVDIVHWMIEGLLKCSLEREKTERRIEHALTKEVWKGASLIPSSRPTPRLQIRFSKLSNHLIG